MSVWVVEWLSLHGEWHPCTGPNTKFDSEESAAAETDYRNGCNTNTRYRTTEYLPPMNSGLPDDDMPTQGTAK